MTRHGHGRPGSHGSHDHASPGSAAGSQFRGRLILVLAMSITVLVVEVAGAAVSGSLALLADAGHMLGDVTGLGLALLAMNFAARPPTTAKTFGYLRAEVLAAFVNAAVLLAIAAWVIVEAVRRLSSEPEVASGVMLAVAALGLVANTVGLLLLHRGQQESLNLRGAYLEVLGDLFGSMAVIAAASVIWLTGFTAADSIASLVICALIVPRAVGLLREAINVLLEATPKGMDLDEVRGHILELEHVVSVHDLHAWSLGTGAPVLSAHVVVRDDCFEDGHAPQLLDQLQLCLAGHFDVEHSTFQLEPSGHSQHEGGSHN